MLPSSFQIIMAPVVVWWHYNYNAQLMMIMIMMMTMVINKMKRGIYEEVKQRSSWCASLLPRVVVGCWS
jgi:hypothetical protein